MQKNIIIAVVALVVVGIVAYLATKGKKQAAAVSTSGDKVMSGKPVVETVNNKPPAVTGVTKSEMAVLMNGQNTVQVLNNSKAPIWPLKPGYTGNMVSALQQKLIPKAKKWGFTQFKPTGKFDVPTTQVVTKALGKSEVSLADYNRLDAEYRAELGLAPTTNGNPRNVGQSLAPNMANGVKK